MILSTSSLLELKHLEKLDLYENRYLGFEEEPKRTIPEVITKMDSIKELNVGMCFLSTLPDRYLQIF